MRSTVTAAALVAGALMATGAFAADTTSPTTSPTTTPTNSYQAMPQTGSTASPTAPATHPTKSQCKSEAKTKNLHGQEMQTFIKNCEAGKAAD